MTDKPTDFDFDFQVDSSRAEPSRRVGDDSPPDGNGRANGAATPRDPEDLDAPTRAGNGSAKPSSSPRRRRRKAADPGGGDGNGRSPSKKRSKGAGNGRDPGRLVRPGEKGREDASGNGAGASIASPKRIRRKKHAPEPEPSVEPQAPAEDDWLGLADSDVGGGGLETFPDTDTDTGAGPRVPREGRNLARASRDRATKRRAEGRNRVDPDDVPFDSVLKSQPQKSKAMRRATPLLDAVREAVGGGVERLKDGAEVVKAGGVRLRELRPPTRQPQTDAAGGAAGAGGGNGRQPPRLGRLASRRPQRPKPGRIKRLRFLIVFTGLALLALVSTFFGMMMAIARDLPTLDTEKQYETAQNSIVYDNHGTKMGTLLNNNQRILIDSEEISPYVKEAVVAIEDERFYEHRGVDFQGLVRAGVSDLIPGGSTQGASTITQQFVKNALEAQNSRTVFQKFRESAYAYHLERQWDKDKILTQYLNTIYFGEGAYGIEAAAQTYFGANHAGCGDEGNRCASELYPEEAALLAGIISSPSAFSPKSFPEAAKERRDLVLKKMEEQGVLDQGEYETSVAASLPAPSEIEKPQEDSAAPYFTSWLRQLVVDKYGANQAFGGGLQIHTTLDLDMQEAVSQIAFDHLAGISPTASVVVLDNATGEIRAMVGGNDYEKEPFNIATQGHRQPGSTMKPFTLVTALSNGRSSSEVFPSGPKDFPIPGVNPNKEVFHVENYEGNYLGSASIATATTYSDNSVYAELGLQVGTGKIANMAEDMGIETPVSDNPAMTLGAVDEGFTPLEMAHAYETIATGGERISGTLDTIPGNSKGDPRDDGPVPINKIVNSSGKTIDKNEITKTRVIDSGVAEETKSILRTVIDSGTGEHASLGGDEWGKTGTTENYGDAWFCGATTDFTACVWVGYPDAVTSMETEYGGEPVAGGTYPAEIWASVMSAVESIYASYGSDYDGGSSSTYGDSSGYSSGSSSYSAPSTGGGGGGGDTSAPAPAAPAPAPSGGGGGAPSGGGVGL